MNSWEHRRQTDIYTIFKSMLARENNHEEALSLLNEDVEEYRFYIYEEVITIAVDTGVQANECISRGNYGSLLIEMNSWELAAEQLHKSIAIGTDIYPIAANVFKSMLAYLRSLENNHEEALSLLNEINYPLIKTDVEEYTKLLCIVATVHHRAENYEQALEAFQEATSLIEKHQFSNTTDAYTKWMKTRELLDSPAK